MFSKRLALYLQAGIPIFEALNLLHASGGSKSHAKFLSLTLSDVREGISLSQSLAKHPQAYTLVHIQMIAVGEQSGTLAEALLRLASSLENRAKQIRSITSALAYPLVLSVGSLAVTIFLITYAFPKIIPLYRGLHTSLPFSTRILLALSSLIRGYWFLLLCIVVALYFIAKVLMHFLPIKRKIDALALQVPILGGLIRASIVATLFRTMATLLSSGVRLDEALDMALDGITNSLYRESLTRVRKHVLAGNRLSDGLGLEPILFPLVAIQLISVGEMTGSLAKSLASVAQIFEDDFFERLRVTSSLLEPLITVVMGFMIGFIAMAIISPLYGITQGLSA